MGNRGKYPLSGPCLRALVMSRAPKRYTVSHSVFGLCFLTTIHTYPVYFILRLFCLLRLPEQRHEYLACLISCFVACGFLQRTSRCVSTHFACSLCFTLPSYPVSACRSRTAQNHVYLPPCLLVSIPINYLSSLSL